MCDVIIPAILGVAALGLLGGGIGGSQGTYVTIPQEVGDTTNAIPCYSYSQPHYAQADQFAYAAPQQAYAQPAYAPQPAYPAQPGYAASEGYYAPQQQPYYDGSPAGYGYPVDSTVGAGVGVDNSGVGIGANVGDFGVGAGVGDGGVGVGVGDTGIRSY